MKAKIVSGLLVIYAFGGVAAGFNGVRLAISPKGISPDAFLFGGVAAVFVAAVLALAWAVYREKQYAALIAALGFLLIAGGFGLLGAIMTAMGLLGATDSYILPIGVLLLGGGALNAAAAWAAWTGRPSGLSG